MARRKNRWVLAKIIFTNRSVGDEITSRVITREAFETELVRLCDILYGTLRGSYILNSTNVVLTNEVDSFVLFQTRRCYLPQVLCLLRCIDNLQKVPISLDVFHVGGTLHHCRKLLFTGLLETLSQLQTLRLTGTTQRPKVTQGTVACMGDVSRIRNPTDF